MITFRQLIELLNEPTSGPVVNIVPIIVSQTKFPNAVVKKGISEGCLTINDKKIRQAEIYHVRNSVIKFQDQKIEIAREPHVDQFLTLLSQKAFNGKSLAELSVDEQNKACSYLVEYFSVYGYNVNELSQSKFNDVILRSLEDFYKRNFHSLDESKPLRKKELIDKLISTKKEELRYFSTLILQVTSEFYDLEGQKLFQDFSHLFNKKGFRYLIRPLLTFDGEPIQLLQKIIKNFRLIITTSDASEKISNRSKAFKEYDLLKRSHFGDSSDPIASGFRSLISYYIGKTDLAVGFKDTGKVLLSLKPEDKRTYNYDSLPVYVHGYLKNNGSGVARDITISRNDDNIVIPKQKLADMLPPGETRKIKFFVEKISPGLDNGASLNLAFRLKWQNDFNEENQFELRKFEIQKQNQNLPWEQLKRTNPYSLIAVDDPNKLFGRDKLLDDLKWNIEHNHSITSFVIYGQKRVGKSSIIRTLDTIYKNDPNIIFIYRTMGDVKNTDPNRTFQKLGESIATKLLHEFRRKNEKLGQYLDSFTKPSFVGSLAPLNEIIEFIHDLNDRTRIIIALDEFDELNNDFFENGEIGKTFALNVGKGLNEKVYVGLILVGSESMEYKTKQGMRLNAFETKKVDTFDRKNEFDSYCRIIAEPTKSCIVFSPDVFDFLFNYTNGNPYYTNSLLHNMFREAYDKRIGFIDLDFVLQSVKHQLTNALTKKDFEHFWNDGLIEEGILYEKILDRRRRFLTAFAQVKKENKDCTWLEVKKRIKWPKKYEITESQMEETLNEFKQRGILSERSSGVLELVPPLFQEWLLGTGLYQVIAQLEDRDEILDRVLQEEKLLLSDSEILETLTILNEPKEKAKTFREYINQFEENNSKRLVTELIRKTLVISMSEILDYLKKVRKEIWGNVELAVGERDIRTDAELICFDDSFEQNKPLSEEIRQVFKFNHNKSIKRISDLSSIDDSIKNVIIYEPLIDCQYFYRNEIAKAVKKVNPSLVRGLKLSLLTFIISDEAKNDIEEFISKTFAFDFRIYSLKVVQRSDIAPYLNDSSAVNDPTFKVISSIKRDTSELSCLVKLGELVPYQCFPILWHSTDRFKSIFTTSASIDTYRKRMSLSLKLKELSFSSETNQLELKGSLSEPAQNWKDILSKMKALKALPPEKGNEIQTIKAELNKLWQLKLDPQEKQIVSSAVRHSIAKTLAAFANTSGGTLYIGIDDDFTVSGLVGDLRAHKSLEGIRREFDNIVNNYLGVANSHLFQIDFLDHDPPVLRAKVINSHTEVWVKVDKAGKRLDPSREEIYIRAQQETRLLMNKEYFEWKQKRLTS